MHIFTFVVPGTFRILSPLLISLDSSGSTKVKRGYSIFMNLPMAIRGETGSRAVTRGSLNSFACCARFFHCARYEPNAFFVQ